MGVYVEGFAPVEGWQPPVADDVGETGESGPFRPVTTVKVGVAAVYAAEEPSWAVVPDGGHDIGPGDPFAIEDAFAA